MYISGWRLRIWQMFEITKKNLFTQGKVRTILQILIGKNNYVFMKKSCPFHLKLHVYLPMLSPISMFLFIMTPRHLDTTKFKISISIWAFGCNAFALSIPFVSSTIRILLTNIPTITAGCTADTMPEMIKLCFNYSKKYIYYVFKSPKLR